ncbi:MAG: trigger factor family protein [Bacteroidales bacterium]|nr:trigger factor family protein [Bacteroidales bacterium]
MNLTKKQIDDLNLELTLEIAPEDYSEAVRKRLAERRRTAEFKGFRKGMVPASLIKRVYGEQALADAVNEVITSSLDKYIEDNQLHLLGEPLGSENQPEIEWVDGNAFTFVFDAALSPEVKVEVEAADVVNKYSITSSAKEKATMIENIKKYYADKKEEAKSDEEIEKDVTERLKEEHRQEADWRLSKDIRDFYVAKAGLVLPEAFLKRWLLAANQGKITAEDVEKDFPGFCEDFKWQLVRGHLMKQFGFTVEHDDIYEAAKAYVTYQYAMYGIGNVPEDMITEAVANMMKDRRQLERLAEQVEDRKVLDKIKETITIKDKKISSEKFREL